MENITIYNRTLAVEQTLPIGFDVTDTLTMSIRVSATNIVEPRNYEIDGTNVIVPETEELGTIVLSRSSDETQPYSAPLPGRATRMEDVEAALNQLFYQIEENKEYNLAYNIQFDEGDTTQLDKSALAGKLVVFDENGKLILGENFDDFVSQIEGYVNTAKGHADEALRQAGLAASSASSASGSATIASTKAGEASNSASLAAASAEAANESKLDAIAAVDSIGTSVQDAQDAANTADEHQQDAQLYRDQAIEAKDIAVSSASSAETNANDAADAAQYAASSETAAASSAQSAATSAAEASDARDDVIEIATLVPTNGFDRSDTNSMGTIAFDSVQRIASIGPKSGQSEFAFWTNGTKFALTSEQTVQIPNTTGAYYVYFDNSGTLRQQNIAQLTPQMFYEFAPVSLIYWNATQQSYAFGDERHGISMASATHIALHQGFGSQYHSGLDIQGLVAGNGTYTGITDGSFADEDITHFIQNVTDSQIMYRLGPSGEWTFETPDNSIGIKESGDTYFSWNEFNGSEWVLSEGTLSTDYFTTFFVATPSVNGPGITRMIGQTTYSSPKEAKAGVIDEVNTITLGGLPSPEFVFLYAVVIDRNGNVQEIDSEGSVLFDLRENKGGTSGISASAANHKDLANVDSASTGVADGHVDNSKPLQLPELTNAEILAWPTPTVGLTVVDTTNDDVLSWDGTEWKSVFGGGESIADERGNIVADGNTGQVTIGSTSRSNLVMRGGYNNIENNSHLNILLGSSDYVQYGGISNVVMGDYNTCEYGPKNSLIAGTSSRVSGTNVFSVGNNQTLIAHHSMGVGEYNNMNNASRCHVVGLNNAIGYRTNTTVVGSGSTIADVNYDNSKSLAYSGYYGAAMATQVVGHCSYLYSGGTAILFPPRHEIPADNLRCFKVTTFVATQDPSPGFTDFVFENIVTVAKEEGGSNIVIRENVQNKLIEPIGSIVTVSIAIVNKKIVVNVNSTWGPWKAVSKLDIILTK